MSVKKQQYSKMDPVSHVLARPDMYCGSTRSRDMEEFVVVDDDYHVERKKVKYSPAILRIFIEPLSNVIDNVARSKKAKKPVTKICVDIDEETGETSFWNDGLVIPIELHEEEGCYNHTLIFGHLLTSSNYDDEEERYDISGRNGLGIKLTNVFSDKFKVRGFDPAKKKVFSQTWTNNMKKAGEPVIKPSKLKKGFTSVVYTPDFNQFGVDGYTDDVLSVYKKFIIDMAMITKVPVYLNGELIPVQNLVDYAKLFSSDEIEEILHIKTKDCEVVLTPASDYQTVSFANGVCTPLGGTHVDSWSEKLFRPLVDKLNKPKKPQISIKDVKQCFRLFVLASVNNPKFDSQSKTKLEEPTVPASVKKTHIAAICKWSVMDRLEDMIRAKEFVVLKKVERKKRGHTVIAGLDAANNEGGKNGHQCTLILVEGLGAKTYAVCGIQVGAFDKKGRDWFGIYPLRGKVLNCRNASATMIAKNNVIGDVIKALNLRQNVDYREEKNYKTLRYGKVMLVTDADCFVPDTPFLIKRDGMLDIVSVENLEKDWNQCEIWSHKGWTPILGLMKKETSKKILEINTYCGLVKCTEDHKFILESGEEILAKDISVGDRLLRTRRIPKTEITGVEGFKELKKKCQELQCYKSTALTNREMRLKAIEKENSFCQPVLGLEESSTLDPEEAYVWGFFFAEGTCDVYTFTKDRERSTEIATQRSQKRWRRCVEKYEKRIEEFDKKDVLTKKEQRTYKETLERLENARKNITRTSVPKSESLYRTNYAWSIANCDKSLLEKVKGILEKRYSYDFSLVEVAVDENRSRSYRLILNGGKKVKDFILKMRGRFYDPKIRKNKKVPTEILNGTFDVQEQFFKGYYDGDGFRALLRDKNAMGFDILGQIGAQGLCYITEQLGYSSSIKHNKGDVYTVHISKFFRRMYPGEVRSIREVDYPDKYVYDIETGNHLVNAGIGGLVVHNCDGIHISGLVLNAIHTLYPSLFEREDPFVTAMQTPIVRVYLGKRDKLFYDEREYKKYVAKYRKKHPDKKINQKYYKGLGSSNDEEVLETFGVKLVEFESDEHTAPSMNKVFHKNYADARKEWLSGYDPENIKLAWTGEDEEVLKLSVSDFVETEMIKFSLDDCKRSIPHVLDGLKESHRKILYVAFLKKFHHNKKVMKVAQFGAQVALNSGYHHGEQNLFDTLIKMAQSFPGSNNIPLFYRDGQFGTRSSGGKDSAPPRYIHTKLDALTRLLYHPEDDELLKHLEDDGKIVEPEFYVPILPTILINGCSAGIGTGWSCSVPSYDPLDLISAVKIWLDNDGKVIEKTGDASVSLLPEIVPWYREWTGTIEAKDGKYISHGRIVKKGTKKVVEELPIGMWTDTFRDKLEVWQESKQISGYKNYCTPKTIRFEISESKDGFTCNEGNLKLTSYIHTTNMVMFTPEGLRKFNSVDEILDYYCGVRYNYYVKRKANILSKLEAEVTLLGNKKRFMEEVIAGKIKLFKKEDGKKNARPTDEMVTELEERKYDKVFKKTKKVVDDDEEEEDNGTDHGYSYLFGMQIRSITAEKINKLKNDVASAIERRDELAGTTEKELWLKDLDVFEKAYKSWVKAMENEKIPKPRKKRNN